MTCNPEGHCWCAELPHGPLPPDPKGCLCPECLRKELGLTQPSLAQKQKQA
jgi:hypothetical protein